MSDDSATLLVSSTVDDASLNNTSLRDDSSLSDSDVDGSSIDSTPGTSLDDSSADDSSVNDSSTNDSSLSDSPIDDPIILISLEGKSMIPLFLDGIPIGFPIALWISQIGAPIIWLRLARLAHPIPIPIGNRDVNLPYLRQ
jgi:hypothetical protein